MKLPCPLKIEFLCISWVKRLTIELRHYLRKQQTWRFYIENLAGQGLLTTQPWLTHGGYCPKLEVFRKKFQQHTTWVSHEALVTLFVNTPKQLFFKHKNNFKKFKTWVMKITSKNKYKDQKSFWFNHNKLKRTHIKFKHLQSDKWNRYSLNVRLVCCVLISSMN